MLFLLFQYSLLNTVFNKEKPENLPRAIKPSDDT